MGKMMMRMIGLFISLGLLAGCADSKYLTEKLFYQAEKEATNIFKKEPAKITDGDYQKTIALFQKVVDAAPLEPLAAKAQFVIAEMYASQGKYREAQAELLEIIRNFSTNPATASQAQLGIGKLCEAQGKWDLALTEYEKLMDLYPMTQLGLNMPLYIVRYYQNKNDSAGVQKAYERGVRHYQKIIQEFAGTEYTPTLQSFLATFHSSQGKFEESIKAWEAVIADSPGSPQAMQACLAKAETYSQGLKNTPKAIETYEEFIKLYPRYEKLADVKIRTGILYYGSNQLAEARKVFSDILDEYADDEDISIKAYLGLAYCYKNEANADKVKETYGKIKELYPDSKAALSVPYLLAQCYEELKFDAKADEAYQEAIKTYESMLESDAKQEWAKKEAANFLALCYIKKKDVNKALQLLRTLSERYPKEPMYLLDMASLYNNLNAPAEAIKVYEEIIQKYPENRLVAQLAQAQIKNLKSK